MPPAQVPWTLERMIKEKPSVRLETERGEVLGQVVKVYGGPPGREWADVEFEYEGQKEKQTYFATAVLNALKEKSFLYL